MDAKLRIDGREVEGCEGMTILEAAEKAGVGIPTLCHHRDFRPTGACRVCVVEIEGAGRLAAACHTPAAGGMVVHTRSPKVLRARKAAIELLLAAHTGPCVTDSGAARCDLHAIASDLEVGFPRFRLTKPRFFPVEDVSPYVRRDLSRCILCFRCVAACNELAGKRVFSAGYRAFESKIIVDNDIALDKDVCKDCYLCVESCPTTALSKAKNPGDKQRGKKMAFVSTSPPIQAADRGNLLPMLKSAQSKSGRISPQFMAKAAESLKLSISDVYGVSTFYSFLSTKPAGANVIRVCKNLPCQMKGSDSVLKGIEDAIGIRPGETTRDKKFSLKLVNCIGACDRAPAMLINDKVYGNLTPEKMPKILKQF